MVLGHYQYLKFRYITFNTFRDMLRTSLLMQKLVGEMTLITCDIVMVLGSALSSFIKLPKMLLEICSRQKSFREAKNKNHFKM